MTSVRPLHLLQELETGTCKHAGGGKFYAEQVVHSVCSLDIILDRGKGILMLCFSHDNEKYVGNRQRTFTLLENRHCKPWIPYRFSCFPLSPSDGHVPFRYSRRSREQNTTSNIRQPQQGLAHIEIPTLTVGNFNLLTPKHIQFSLQVILLVG
jgi:hypothetical protein